MLLLIRDGLLLRSPVLTLKPEECIDPMTMQAKFARSYVFLLFVIEGLLLATSLRMHVSLLMGIRRLYENVPDRLFVGGLLLAFVTGFLAKGRNIWKNEFKSCPLWLQVLITVLVLYGFISGFLRTVVFPDAGNSEMLTVSGLSLSIDAMSLCILYSFLWTHFEQGSELLKRSRNSLVAAILVSVYLLADHARYFPHQNR
jgi:hypothetical protein